MESNVGIYDTILRICIGMIFAAVCGAFGWIIGVLALYPIVTGLAAFDPMYHYWGYTTYTVHPEVSDKIDYSNSTVQDSPETMPEYRQTA